MAKLFIGYKPGVGGVVKVMRYNGDDPLTTPNSAYGKFLFNSENSKVGYVEYFARYARVGGLSENSDNYYPGGTNINTCYKYISNGVNIQYQWVFPSRIINRGNTPIVYERREQKALGTTIKGPEAFYTRVQTGNSYLVGENISLGPYRMWLEQLNNRGINSPIAGRVGGDFRWMSEGSFTNNTSDRRQPMLITIMDLPADNSPIPSASAGASGSRNTLINPTTVRIAKGGVNVGAGRDGMIIDSDRVPMKVVRAGQVNVSSNSSTDITSPVTLGENTYLDYMVWESGGPAYVPQPITTSGGFVDDYKIKMDYRIFAGRVRIFNNGPSGITVRYMICHDDGRRNSGGSQVLRQLGDKNIQIKRPGSSDSNPLSKDILLDTRFAYPPIIEEGYVHHSQFSGNTFTVNFNNDGSFLPFLKFYVTFDGGDHIAGPMVKVFRTNPSSGWDGAFACDATYARVNNASVTFYMYRDQPADVRDDNNGRLEPRYNSYYRPDGYRYYIFGIPNSF